MQLFQELMKAAPFLSAQFTEKEIIRFSICDYRKLDPYYKKYTPWICKNLLGNNTELYRLFLLGGIHDRNDMAIILLQTLHLVLRT